MKTPGGRNSNPLQYPCLENPHGQEPSVPLSIWLQRVRHDLETEKQQSLYVTIHHRRKLRKRTLKEQRRIKGRALKDSFFLSLFFFFFNFVFLGHTTCGILVPQPRSNWCPLPWKRGVLPSGTPKMTPKDSLKQTSTLYPSREGFGLQVYWKQNFHT